MGNGLESRRRIPGGSVAKPGGLIAHMRRIAPVVVVVALLGAPAQASAAPDHLGTDFWTGFMFQQRGCGGIGGNCNVTSAKSIWIAGAPGTTGSVIAGVPPVTFP